jgi:hypothetical protein
MAVAVEQGEKDMSGDVEFAKPEVKLSIFFSYFRILLASCYDLTTQQFVGGIANTPVRSEDVAIDAENALRWRQDKRIIPLSASIYFLCYLDRSNIGMWSSCLLYATLPLRQSRCDSVITNYGVDRKRQDPELCYTQ